MNILALLSQHALAPFLPNHKRNIFKLDAHRVIDHAPFASHREAMPVKVIIHINFHVSNDRDLTALVNFYF